jgi:wee1-like protein kinase
LITSNYLISSFFLLGLTLYEAAGGGPLPKNGEEWHSIRDGKLKSFPHFSNEFNNLLKVCIYVSYLVIKSDFNSF